MPENEFEDIYNSLSGKVYGSVAYSYSSAAPELPQENEEQRLRKRPKQKKPITESIKHALIADDVFQTKQSLAPFTVLGIIIAAMLFAVLLASMAQLSGIASGTVSLQSQLKELQAENKQLLINYESAFNMSDIENIAVVSFGMQKPTSERIHYIDTSSGDKSVVLNNTEYSLTEKLISFFTDIKQLFV